MFSFRDIQAGADSLSRAARCKWREDWRDCHANLERAPKSYALKLWSTLKNEIICCKIHNGNDL